MGGFASIEFTFRQPCFNLKDGVHTKHSVVCHLKVPRSPPKNLPCSEEVVAEEVSAGQKGSCTLLELLDGPYLASGETPFFRFVSPFHFSVSVMQMRTASGAPRSTHAPKILYAKGESATISCSKRVFSQGVVDLPPLAYKKTVPFQLKF